MYQLGDTFEHLQTNHFDVHWLVLEKCLNYYTYVQQLNSKNEIKLSKINLCFKCTTSSKDLQLHQI